MIVRVLLMSVLLLLSACGSGTGSGEDHAGHEHGDEAQLYTCGMHPEVVQEGPGTCPICGMDLTPMKTKSGRSSGEDGGEREVAYWVAPMDSTYIRDEPGKSPMGMDLVPVYTDEIEGSSVVVDPATRQSMGVRLERAHEQTVFRHLRTVGEVEVGEDEVSVVNLRFSGWVEDISVDKTGDPVKRGQRLFTVYSPELVQAQEELLLASRAQGADSPLARSARRKLELWDISGYDIDRLVKDGEVRRELPVRAPRDGFVLSKSVVEGARVKAGEDLYRIGNLQRIWVTAEVYAFDAPWVEEGQPAQMEVPYGDIDTLEGRVAYIYPTLNEKSRTLTVRLEFDNPGIRLKPGMFATVYIEYRRKDDVLAVPSEAILNTGTREIVFVTTGDGHFSPREIRTGLVGDRGLTEVVEGLRPGELVVASGQFLIDSESQLQEALNKMRSGGGAAAQTADETQVWSCPMHPEVLADEPGRCPECGMDLELRDGTPAELEEVYGPAGAQPGQYTCPMHPEVVEDEAGRCPICGMFLEQVPEEHDHGAPE